MPPNIDRFHLNPGHPEGPVGLERAAEPQPRPVYIVPVFSRGVGINSELRGIVHDVTVFTQALNIVNWGFADLPTRKKIDTAITEHQASAEGGNGSLPIPLAQEVTNTVTMWNRVLGVTDPEKPRLGYKPTEDPLSDRKRLEEEIKAQSEVCFGRHAEKVDLSSIVPVNIRSVDQLKEIVGSISTIRHNIGNLFMLLIGSFNLRRVLQNPDNAKRLAERVKKEGIQIINEVGITWNGELKSTEIPLRIVQSMLGEMLAEYITPQAGETDPLSYLEGVSVLCSLGWVGNLGENVVQNQEKYNSNPQPQMQVTYETTPDRKFVVIRITDNGIGYPTEIIQRGFQPEVSINPNGGEKIGNGIGLASVLKTLQLFGGHMNAENIIDKDGKVQGGQLVVFIPLAGQDSQGEKNS